MGENLSLNPTYNYCNCRRDYNSRAKLIEVKTKAQSTMSEIAKNPVPPDKSLLLPPNPAIDTQIATVKRDSVRRFRMAQSLDLSGGKGTRNNSRLRNIIKPKILPFWLLFASS